MQMANGKVDISPWLDKVIKGMGNRCKFHNHRNLEKKTPDTNSVSLLWFISLRQNSSQKMSYGEA